MFSRKLYLDGFDWIAALLNYDCRLTPGRGNHFMLVLESEAPFPEDAVRTLLNKLDPLLPMLNGSIRRHLLHLAPYWRPGKPEAVVFTEEELLFPSDFPLAVERFANRPLPRGQALAVHAISRPKGRSALIFKFSHLLFDGRGAELLLELLRHGKTDPPEEHPGLASPMLNEWEKQFSCGRQIQHRLLEIQKEGPTAVRRACSTAAAAFRVLSLTEEETEALRRRSDRDAGPFMLTPYLLALTAKGYDRLIPHRTENEHFLIPMSIDMRGQDSIPRDALFFNQWSLLPVSIPRSLLADPADSIPEIRKQIFIRTGERTALAYRAASRLMRIAPPPLLLKIVRKMGNSTSGTFMFSFVSGTSLEHDRFAGGTIANLYHLPAMPPMTGFGVFFNAYNNRLNAVLSYRSGIFPESDIEHFAAELEHSLKGTS